MILIEHNMCNFSVVSIHMDVFSTMCEKSLNIDIIDPCTLVKSLTSADQRPRHAQTLVLTMTPALY